MQYATGELKVEGRFKDGAVQAQANPIGLTPDEQLAYDKARPILLTSMDTNPSAIEQRVLVEELPLALTFSSAKTMVNSLTAVVDSSAVLRLTETEHANNGSYVAFDGQAMAIHGGWRAPSYKTSHVAAAEALQDIDASVALTSGGGLTIPPSEGIQKVQALCKAVYTSGQIRKSLCSVRGNVYCRGAHGMGAHKDIILLKHALELEEVQVLAKRQLLHRRNQQTICRAATSELQEPDRTRQANIFLAMLVRRPSENRKAIGTLQDIIRLQHIEVQGFSLEVQGFERPTRRTVCRHNGRNAIKTYQERRGSACQIICPGGGVEDATAKTEKMRMTSQKASLATNRTTVAQFLTRI